MGVFCEDRTLDKNRLWQIKQALVDKASFAYFCDGSGDSGRVRGKGPLCVGVFCEAYNHRLWIGEAFHERILSK